MDLNKPSPLQVQFDKRLLSFAEVPIMPTCQGYQISSLLLELEYPVFMLFAFFTFYATALGVLVQRVEFSIGILLLHRLE